MPFVVSRPLALEPCLLIQPLQLTQRGRSLLPKPFNEEVPELLDNEAAFGLQHGVR